MKIDPRLNLVFPIECEGGPFYVHAMPIGREVFERHFLVIGKVFTAIWANGLGIMGGPRVAALMLRKVAEDMGVWDGANGVAQSLMAEIRRLANVVMPDGGVWRPVPLEDALARDLLSADDVADVEGSLVFFTLVSAMNKRGQISAILAAAADYWGTKTSSLGLTAFIGSLPTSTPAASSGETAVATSVPS